jgi:hypothetical protein
LIAEHKQEPAEEFRNRLKEKTNLCHHHIISRLSRNNIEETVKVVLILMKQSLTKQISARKRFPDSAAA